MIITVNVNVTGLDSIVAILGKLVSAIPETTVTTAAPLVQAPQVQQAPVQQQSIQQAPVQQAQAQQFPQQQIQQAQQASPQPLVPTVPATYTIEQLALAATQLMDAGRQQDILALLAAFQVPALMQLPPAAFGDFATRLRALGAKI